jgi:Peptidase family M23
MPQNPFNNEENLQSLFEQDQRYNFTSSQSKSKILKTKFNFFTSMKNLIYLISHSTVLATIFAILLFTTITTSAQIIAPNQYKPATFLCQNFSKCDIITGCPFGSTIVKPEIADNKYTWPTTGCISRCMELGHNACDIDNLSLPAVVAIDDGVVEDVYRFTVYGYGNAVLIKHENGLTSLYAHLNEISVTKGQNLKNGEKLGQMGNTGNSNEIHLHIEIKQDGINKNPLDFLVKS